MAMRRVRGLSLTELLSTLAILAILSRSSVAVSQWIDSARADSAARQIIHSIQFARLSAVSSGRNTLLCGSEDGLNCSRHWHADSSHVIVFHDANQNRRRDASEPLLLNARWQEGEVQWRAARRSYLRFRRNGSAKDIGTFTWCPADLDPSEARQFTINFAGRVYTSRDKNGDGIHEPNRGGGAISCSG